MLTGAGLPGTMELRAKCCDQLYELDTTVYENIPLPLLSSSDYWLVHIYHLDLIISARHMQDHVVSPTGSGKSFQPNAPPVIPCVMTDTAMLGLQSMNAAIRQFTDSELNVACMTNIYINIIYKRCICHDEKCCAFVKSQLFCLTL